MTQPFPDEATRQRLILNEVGDVDPVKGDLLVPYLTNQDVLATPGLCATQIADYWAQYAWLGVEAPFQQDAYVKRHLIDVVIGKLQDLVQQSDPDAAVQYSGRIATLFRMREAVVSDLAVWQSGSAPTGELARTGVVSPITRTASWMPPPNAPDANDPAFSGSPYRRWSWRW